MERFDAIVLGAAGGTGSAALYHLARRGARVVGVDRFAPGHARGSSHGETRIIRLAYMESPEYVPLLRRAFDLWAALADERDAELYRETGLLQIGRRDGELLAGVRASAARFELPVEELGPADVASRFGIRVEEGHAAVLDPRAGYLWVERCVEAHAAAAVAAGAELRTGVAARSWRAEGDGVVVETDQGPLAGERLVVAAGPWAGRVLAGLGLPLEVRRKETFWFDVQGEAYDPERGFPVWLYEGGDGRIVYGLPRVSPRGLKVSEHSGGTPYSGDPLDLPRGADPAEEAWLAAFLGRHFTGVGARRDHSVCMYTMTPDEHFVVDRHPAHPQVVFAAGLSGHGFKLTPVLGELLADLALAGRSDLPADFLGLDRPALRRHVDGERGGSGA